MILVLLCHRKVSFIFGLGCRTKSHPRDIYRLGVLEMLQPPINDHSSEHSFSTSTGDIQLEKDLPPAANISILIETSRGIQATCPGKWAICLLIFKPLGSFSCQQELKRSEATLLLVFHQSRFAANAHFFCTLHILDIQRQLYQADPSVLQCI